MPELHILTVLKYNIPMKKRTIAKIIISAALASLPLAAYAEYRKDFFLRMSEPTGFTDWYFREHPELHHETFSCPSDKGPLIKGIILQPEEGPKALIVMTHGYNMSCENYIALAHQFQKAGFAVLMFDGIGIGISEGDRIYGLPQHILDMDSVLHAIGSDPMLKKLPLLLFGHSWGGYAACCISAISKYPIKGILTLGAFRKSLSSMIPTIHKRYPHAAPLLISSIEVLEKFLFGKVASLTSPEGLRKADCPARLYHSRDDAVVSYEESFLSVQSELEDLKNVEFISMDGRNHDIFLDPENDRSQRAIRKELASSHDSEICEELTARLWSLMSEADETLAEEFISFFSRCI